MTAAYDLGGMMIRPCRLNIRSVKAVPTPTAATVTTAGGTLLGSTDGDSTMTEVMTPPAATELALEAPKNTNTSSDQQPQNLCWRPRRTPTHLWKNLQWQC